jgi:hypothetical protein
MVIHSIRYRTILLLLNFVLAISAIGQENVIGFETGKNKYKFNISDTANASVNLPRAGRWTFGVSYIHAFKSGVSLELGLFNNKYIQQYGSTLYEFCHEEVYKAWIIPFKFGYRFKFFKEKLILSPTIGYAQGIKTDTYVRDYYGLILNFDQGGVIDSTTRGTFYYNRNKFFPMLVGGIRLMVVVAPRVRLSVVWEQYEGLTEIAKASYFTNVGSGVNDHYGEQTGKSSYSSWRLSLHYAWVRPAKK